MEPESQRFSAGSAVWIADEEDAWIETVVVKQEDDFVTVKRINGSTEEQVLKVTECFAKEEEGKGVDDMTKMSYLHEPGVLQNLFRRYKLNQIYTYTGSILIAVNPFTRLPGLYDSTMKAQYQGARLGDLAPHVFAIADTAYRAMIQDNRSQSVLISGESGAGKTETTKLVMEYLAGVGGRTSNDRTNVEAQVLESNPILEAFGNAKTVRNNNSSRFGKFIEIQFDKKGRVSGAAIKSYLLERSRVVQIKNPERNYHCFYQLCYGASPEEVVQYFLPGSSKRAEGFHYLNQSQCYELGGKESNAEEYRNTRRAMDVLGFSKDEQSSVFAIVAAILHLGNVEFLQKGTGDALGIKPGAPQTHLQCVADLLRVDRAALEESLCTITRKVAGETLKSPLDAKSAAAKRDSLAKNLYSTMFDWIVAKINESIGVDHEAEAFIGVLDIYGFEHFETNSFEQFCINLANEKLQQHFNQHVLKTEQEEYEREQINWSRIPFADNQDVLDVIEKDQGILSLLDSACKLASTTAESLTLNLQRKFQAHKRFSKSKISKLDFVLEHYAGKVKYSTGEFISKNIDAVVPEHHSLLAASLDPFLANLFPREKASAKQNKFVSLGNSFKHQLGELMQTLNRTEPHYIRCVKPNTKLKPHIFEKALVMTQLRSGGVLEAVRMCSAGYPTRKTFDEFIEKFALLAPTEIDLDGEEKENVQKIMEKTGLDNYQIGLSKVFLRAGQMVLLDTLRLEKMNRSAMVIQKAVRAYHFAKHRKRANLVLQTAWRGYIAVRTYKTVREVWAAVVAQKYARAAIQRRRYEALKKAAVITQTLWRAKQAEVGFVNFSEKQAAVLIQKTWRGYKSRQPLKELRRFVRGRIARKKLAKLKKEASLRDDLVHQANEANKRASLATSQALQGSLRFMVIQKLKEKSDRTRKEALQQLSVAQKEVLELRAALSQREEEASFLQGALQEAQTEASVATESLEKAIREKALLLSQLEKPRVAPQASRATTPRSSPKLSPVPESPPEPLQQKLPELLPQRPPETAARTPGPSPQPPASTPEDQLAPTPSSPKGLEASKHKPSKSAPPTVWLPEVQAGAAKEDESHIPTAVPVVPPLNTRRLLLRSVSSRIYRGAASPPSTPVTPRSGGESEAFTKLASSLMLETEASRKLRTEVQALRAQRAEAEAMAESALREVEALAQTRDRVQEQLESREAQLREMEGRVLLLQERLAGKERLEQEVKVLSNRILALTAVDKPQLPPDKQQEVLLREVGGGQNLGFSLGGYPVTAVLVYKALCHWRTFEAEKTNTFDRVVETFQQAERDGTISELAYWMTNTVWLYFLVQQYRPPPPPPGQSGFLFFGGSPQKRLSEGEERADTMLFKIQLGTSVQRLYITVRDSVKEELLLLLSGSSAPPVHGYLDQAHIPRSGSVARRHVANYWTSLLIVLRQTVDTLQTNNVPPLVVQGMLKQLLAVVDVKIFNSLMVRSLWCPCTYSNGEAMEAGLQRLLLWLEDVQYWLADALGNQVEPMAQELCHLSQAVQFLVSDRKPKRSMEEFLRLCPDLSMNQLVHMCIGYEDDKYGTQGVNPDVIERMFSLMLEDSPKLLKDDESIPFSVEEVLSTLASFDINEVEPPTNLVQDASFIFLLPEDPSGTSRLPSIRSPLWGDGSFGLLKSISSSPLVASRRFDPVHNSSRRRSYEPPPR